MLSWLSAGLRGWEVNELVATLLSVLSRTGGYIAPKKASLVKANKLKKVCTSSVWYPPVVLFPSSIQGLERAIGQKIEQDVIQLATKSGENLRVVSGSSSKGQTGKNKS